MSSTRTRRYFSDAVTGRAFHEYRRDRFRFGLIYWRSGGSQNSSSTITDDRDMVTVGGEQTDVNVYFGLQTTFNNSITARIVNEKMGRVFHIYFTASENVGFVLKVYNRIG